jgi:hypothetical protein
VRGWPLALTVAAGCSTLTDQGGVVGLQIRTPRVPVIEVGQTTVTLTSDGRLTGRTGGQTARVQAQAGSLVSDFVTFTVNPRPDTVVITGDSILTVASSAATSAPLLASLQSLNPAEPLSGRVLTYIITAPAFADPSQRTVELPGGVLTLAATTGADGTPESSVVVSRVSGRTAPDSSIVTVSATTATGAVVPGSGQRFIVRFQ